MYIKTIKRDRERKHFKIQYSKKKITRETLVLGVEWPGFRALVSNSSTRSVYYGADWNFTK